MLKKILILLLISLPHITWTVAQNDDNALIRIVHTQPTPSIQVYFDDELFAGDYWNEKAFRPQWIYPHLAYPEGDYELAVIADNGTLSHALKQRISIEADHRYSLIIYETNPIRYMWIDETATVYGHNLDEESIYILVNLIDDAGSISVVIDEETTLADLAYGEFAMGVDPPSPVSSVEIIADEGKIIASYPDVETYIQGAYFLTIYDLFPGYGYAGLPIPQYVGDITLTDTINILLNELVEGEITEVGHRVPYRLTLATDSTISATLLRTTPTQRSFPSGMNLRVYNDTHELLWQDDNDEQQTRLQSLELVAGSYVLEVGTMGDADIATYSLIVSSE